jgi:hypothetical protein
MESRCKLFIINNLIVKAARRGFNIRVENKQVIDFKGFSVRRIRSIHSPEVRHKYMGFVDSQRLDCA